MFDSETALQGVSTLIQERVESDHQVDLLDLGELSHYLSRVSQIDEEKTEKLIWAENAYLEKDEISRLASVLSAHRDLLACLMVPSSFEQIEQLLRNISQRMLAVHECATCEELSEAVDSAAEMDPFELTELALEMLSHLNLPDEQAEHILEEAPFEKEPLVELDSQTDQLLRVFSGLSEEARERVLARAYWEATEEDTDYTVEGLYNLRQHHLSPLAIRVFDELAKSNDGQLSKKELVRILDLADARPLGHLLRSVEKSVSKINNTGYSLKMPLEQDRQKKKYSLSKDSLEIWRIFLKTESKSV